MAAPGEGTIRPANEMAQRVRSLAGRYENFNRRQAGMVQIELYDHRHFAALQDLAAIAQGVPCFETADDMDRWMEWAKIAHAVLVFEDGRLQAAGMIAHVPMLSGKVELQQIISVRPTPDAQRILHGLLAEMVRRTPPSSNSYYCLPHLSHNITHDMLDAAGYVEVTSLHVFSCPAKGRTLPEMDRFHLDVYRGGDDVANQEIYDINKSANTGRNIGINTTEFNFSFNESGYYIRLFDKNSVCGIIHACLDQGSGQGKIADLAVRRRYWGTQAARILIASSLFYLEQDGAKEILVDVVATNAASLRYQNEFGWTLVERQVSYGLPNETAMALVD